MIKEMDVDEEGLDQKALCVLAGSLCGGDSAESESNSGSKSSRQARKRARKAAKKKAKKKVFQIQVCLYCGCLHTQPDTAWLLNHPEADPNMCLHTTGSGIPEMAWHRHSKAGLPEAGACKYCGVAHMLSPTFRPQKRKDVVAALHANPKIKSAWMKTRAEIALKYARGSTARGITDPVVQVDAATKSYSRCKGPKKKFMTVKKFMEQHNGETPADHDIPTYMRTYKGVTMEGLDVLDGEEGIFDLSSGDEESVVITKKLDDGSFTVHQNQQQSLFNSVQASLNDARPQAITLKKLEAIRSAKRPSVHKNSDSSGDCESDDDESEPPLPAVFRHCKPVVPTATARPARASRQEAARSSSEVKPVDGLRVPRVPQPDPRAPPAPRAPVPTETKPPTVQAAEELPVDVEAVGPGGKRKRQRRMPKDEQGVTEFMKEALAPIDEIFECFSSSADLASFQSKYNAENLNKIIKSTKTKKEQALKADASSLGAAELGKALDSLSHVQGVVRLLKSSKKARDAALGEGLNDLASVLIADGRGVPVFVVTRLLHQTIQDLLHQGDHTVAASRLDLHIVATWNFPTATNAALIVSVIVALIQDICNFSADDESNLLSPFTCFMGALAKSSSIGDALQADVAALFAVLDVEINACKPTDEHTAAFKFVCDSSTTSEDAGSGKILRAFLNTDLGGKVSVKIKDASTCNNKLSEQRLSECEHIVTNIISSRNTSRQKRRLPKCRQL